MKKKKLLLFVDVWVSGGIPKYIVDILERINKDLFECTVLTTQIRTELFIDKVEMNCGKIQVLSENVSISPIKRVIIGLLKFSDAIEQIKPDIIHMHASNGTMLFYAYIAKKNGIKNVIVHSHSTDFGNGHRLIKKIGHIVCKLMFSKYADVNVACSKEAGEWMFSSVFNKNKFKCIKCFTEVSKFLFDENEREYLRKKLGINEEKVFINVGRFNYQKNQIFLLKLFKLLRNNMDLKLLMIGEGELESELRKKVRELDLINDVFFIGTTHEIEKYMWASDAFLLPSLYEGNPLTAVEAQASGLQCYLSNTITKEAKLIDNTFFINIRDIKSCVEVIVDNICYALSDAEKKECPSLVRNKGYNSNVQMMELEEIYLKGNTLPNI